MLRLRGSMKQSGKLWNKVSRWADAENTLAVKLVRPSVTAYEARFITNALHATRPTPRRRAEEDCRGLAQRGKLRSATSIAP